METNSVDYLRQLRNNYKNHSVSVLVGAGFSRNAYNRFPLWDELLRDLVIEMYGEQIQKSYNTDVHAESYQDYQNVEIKRILEKEDYTNLVSEYIRRKGRREAIDVYIEERIPYLTNHGGKYELSTDPSFPFSAHNLDVHADLLRCDWVDVYTTNYDNLLEEASKNTNFTYRKIVNGYELSKTNTISRSIIKLHGDLSGDTLEDRYEFDGDKNLRYIISQEDYDTYPENHDAFTTQMKSSMLQGCFLLIGFSGTDPNFTNWLKWMKKVMDKAPNSNKEDKKIYLLLLEKPTSTSKDLELSYKNNRIAPIYMDDKELIEEISCIESVNSLSECALDKKFNLLFNYLRDTEGERNKRTKRNYNQLWSQLETQVVKGNDVTWIVDSIYRYIPSYRNQRRIVLQKRVFDALRKKNDWTPNVYRCANAILKDMGVYGSLLFDEALDSEKTKKLDFWKRENAYAKLLTNKYEIHIDCKSDDETKYQNILYHAFNLDIIGLKDAIINWKPMGRYVQMWSVLYVSYDSQTAIESLDKYISKEQNNEDRYNASFIRNCMDIRNHRVYNYDEYAEVDGFVEISEDLISDIIESDERIKPRGWSGKEYNLGSGNKKAEAAIRFVDLMLKTGILPSVNNVNIVNSKDWYAIFCQIYELFTYPSLFYSLQISDKNVLIRIGQDYSTSDVLYETLPDIASKLIRCIRSDSYFGNPEAYWIILSEILGTVDVDEWINEYVDILDNVFLSTIDHTDSYSQRYVAIKKCNKYIYKNSHKQKVLEVIVKYANTNPISTADLILGMKLDFEIIDSLRSDIVDLVNTLPISKSYLWAAILLDNKEIYTIIAESVADRLSEEVTLINDGDIIHTLTYLTHNNSRTIASVKKRILSLNIWNCGIKSSSSCSSPYYLDLSEISKDIVWSKNEIDVICENIDNNLTLLESFNIHNRLFFDNYINILEGIVFFIKDRLQENQLPILIGLLSRAESLITKAYNGNEFYQALSSNDAKWISINGNNLIREIRHNGFAKYLAEITMFLTKAMIPQQKGFMYVLSFVTFLTREHLTELRDRGLLPIISSMLSKYVTYDWRGYDINIPKTYKSLNQIAKNVQGVITDNADVRYWMTSEKVLRYNIIH